MSGTSAKELLKDPKKLDELAKSAFKSIDHNGNGEIDFKELKDALCDLSDKEVQLILNELDKDKSGKVSYLEFKTNIAKIIEELF